MLHFARLYTIAALLVVLLIPSLSSASLGSSVTPWLPDPFGGTVISVLPCLTAPGFFAVNMIERLSIPPYFTYSTYILSPLSPFLSHVPPHPGQNVIGKSFGMYSCIIDLNPKHYVVWFEPFSVFYGSSL